MEPDISLFSIPSQLFLTSYHVMSTYIDSKSEGNASVEIAQLHREYSMCAHFLPLNSDIWPFTDTSFRRGRRPDMPILWDL